MVNFSAALTAFLLLAGSNTVLAGDTMYFVTTLGDISCESKPSEYDSVNGFPKDSKCWFGPQAGATCELLSGLRFTEGELKGKLVYPTTAPQGWMIKGNPGENAAQNERGYNSNIYYMHGGTQYGAETGLTGKPPASAEEVKNYQLYVDAWGNGISYGALEFVPSAVIMQGEPEVIAGIVGPESGANVYVGSKAMDGPTSPEGDTTNVQFCFTKPSNPNPDPNPNPNPSSGGDPHFKTWSGQKFDFHGGCDLVLLQNAGFNHGHGLDVHIRTKIESSWSFIDTAAVRLGDHTLEIAGGLNQIVYWLDGVLVANMETGDAALGDYAIHFRRINDHQSQTRLDLGNGNALSIETFKHFVRVNIKAASPDAFVGTYGMLGSYPTGQKVARDMVTVIDDDNEFGNEWQVLAKEAKIFHNEGAVQHPDTCLMPDATRKSEHRRLGESMISEEDAGLACARVADEDRDACIFDVMATNDKDMAGSY